MKPNPQRGRQKMKIWTAVIAVFVACGCAIYTISDLRKTVTLCVGEKAWFGKGHRSFVQVLQIDEIHHRATVEVWNFNFKERVWIRTGGFAQTSLWGTNAIKLLSIDGEKAVLQMEWAEHR